MGQPAWQTVSSALGHRDAPSRTRALALCAPALLSLWLQYNAYSFFYFAGTSVENNGLLLLRGSLNILLGVLLLRFPTAGRPRAYAGFSLAGFVLMTVSSLLFFAMGWGVVGTPARFAFEITGTLGLIACAVSWADLLSRMDTHVANVSIVASCGIGAFVGALIGLLPGTAYGVAMLFVPALLLIAHRYLDARVEACREDPSAESGGRGGGEPFEPALAVRLVAGMCLLALGIGFGIECRFSGTETLPAVYAAAHQFVLAALCLVCLVLSARGVQMSLGHLWVVCLACAVVGLSLYTVGDGAFSGLAFLTLARQLGVGLAVLSCFNARTAPGDGTVRFFLVAYGAFILSCALGGRAGMLLFERGAYGTVLVVSIAVPLFVGSLLAFSGTFKTLPVPMWRLPGEGRADSRAEGVAAGSDAAPDPTHGPGPDAATGSAAEALPGSFPDAARVAGFAPALGSTPDPDLPAPAMPELVQARFGLTDRETEVALMLARGRSIAYVGEALNISQNTVRNHARNIYSKLGVHTKQELIDVVEGLE